MIVGCEDDTLSVSEKALRGGARVLQYRGKNKSGSAQCKEAMALRQMTLRYGAKLVVNDRTDIASLVQADGLHLGEKDLPLSVACRMVRPETIIGATAHSLDEAEKAIDDGADYIGFGSVYPTRSKKGATVSGLENLKEVVQKVPVPVIGIGGITCENVGDVMDTGVHGVAVLSAISCAEDITDATKNMLNDIDRYTCIDVSD